MTATEITIAERLRERATDALIRLGALPASPAVGADVVISRTPITGTDLLPVARQSAAQVADAIGAAQAAFEEWCSVPAPVRGEFVKRFGEKLREHKEDLADLVTLEVGKIRSEALGEIQEMIDIADFAVGLARQLYGLTMPSERVGHRLQETWHPLGVVSVISAFNFPAAVWSWNAALAFVCGDAVVWKPSSNTVLTALGCQALVAAAADELGVPAALSQVVVARSGDASVLVDDPRVKLVSATGSERMGAEIAPRVAARFGRTILELGGNNAAIVTPSADLDIAVRGIVFAAAGTAGQRCTTMRRLIVHSSVADDLVGRLSLAYGSLPIGDPFDASTLVGPIIDGAAYAEMTAAIGEAKEEGGSVVAGGVRREHPGSPNGYYVEPTIVEMPEQSPVVHRETFAPILYVLRYETLDEAIRLQNSVPQGLSSSIFTNDVREAEAFLSARGSDCGIANVNIGTSGAEIGGAFGGEKTTGGGRESGSDAWKAYMRRATNTINYSRELPLAQGVNFG